MILHFSLTNQKELVVGLEDIKLERRINVHKPMSLMRVDILVVCVVRMIPRFLLKINQKKIVFGLEDLKLERRIIVLDLLFVRLVPLLAACVCKDDVNYTFDRYNLGTKSCA